MISVNGLVAMDSLGLTFLAGFEGGDRLVTWAHAVDLPDPWRWVAAGDLVMTTGAGIPAEPAEQARWLGKLADTQVSALVVALRPDAPEISHEMVAEAEARRFPLLVASFELEFIKLARTVIESALKSQRDRLSAGQRLFETYAAALRGGVDFPGRLDELGRRLGWHLEVDDVPSGHLIAASDGERADDVKPVSLQIPGRGKAVLSVWPSHPRVVVDPLLVHYLAGLVGIELETQAMERDSQRAEGEALLRDLIAGTIEWGATRTALERRGLHGDLVALAADPSGTATRSLSEIHHAPDLARKSPLLLADADGLIAVVPDDAGFIRALTRSLGADTLTGISAPITGATGVAESIRQAKLALAQVRESGTTVVSYNTGPEAATLTPRTVAEARALVGRFLGPLIHYDEQNRTSLVATLATFLANDGSWKATANELHIHRQTLVYRLRTVEQLTGLKPTSTTGTASFWLAFQAGRAVGIVPS